MNEAILLLQLCIILAALMIAQRLGKEALVVWIALQALLANLFVLKQITLFGLEVTSSDSYAVGSLLGVAVLQRCHGDQSARLATNISFFTLLFFVVISRVHLLYLPNQYDHYQPLFEALLVHTPRIVIVSIIVFFIAQRAAIFFGRLLAAWRPAWSFAVRTACALVLTVCIDTLLFSFGALYGIVACIWHVIIVSGTIKLTTVLLSSFLLRWMRI